MHKENDMTRIEHPTPLLRRALALDAIASGSMALLLTAGAGILGPLFGLPKRFVLAVGLALAPFAAAVAFAAASAEPPRPLVQAIIALNALWVLESIAVLLLGWLQPTAAGAAFIVAQAVVVAAFAAAEFLGLKHSCALQARSGAVGLAPRTP
jgi:hypothetical protein